MTWPGQRRGFPLVNVIVLAVLLSAIGSSCEAQAPATIGAKHALADTRVLSPYSEGEIGYYGNGGVSPFLAIEGPPSPDAAAVVTPPAGFRRMLPQPSAILDAPGLSPLATWESDGYGDFRGWCYLVLRPSGKDSALVLDALCGQRRLDG